MNIQTQCSDRREMVHRLSSYLQTPAVYMRVPTCAYRIGEITVERDGTITACEEVLTRIKPFLIKCGYVDAEQSHTAFSASLSDWTVPQMINLIRLLCSRQQLIRRMMKAEDFFIEPSFVQAISENPPAKRDDLEARLLAAIRAECIRSMTISNSTIHIFLSDDVPSDTAEEFFTRLLALAQRTVRIRMSAHEPESEKYAAHAFLMQLGLNGADHKELRNTLTSHLTGYAAFKSEAEMQAHKARQVQARRSRREAALA